MNKWPNNLPKPVDPLDNFLLAKEQSKRTQDGKVPDIRELMAELERTVSAARGIAQPGGSLRGAPVP